MVRETSEIRLTVRKVKNTRPLAVQKISFTHDFRFYLHDSQIDSRILKTSAFSLQSGISQGQPPISPMLHSHAKNSI